jgi:hypothetical protein
MVMGGADAMSKLLEVFSKKLEDSESKPLFDGTGEHQGINSLEAKLRFECVLEEAFKDVEEFPGAKAAY